MTMATTFSTDSDVPLCSHCHRNALKESTTTYTSHGKAYDCTHCGRKTFVTSTTTGEDPISNEPEKRKETWFDRDKKEKRFFKIRKKRK